MRQIAWRARALVIGLSLAAAPLAAEEADLDGLWKGMLIAQPAEVEAEITIEIAATAEGEWVGTFDLPVQNYIFHPFDRVELDGRKVYLEYHRNSERRGPGAVYILQGELAEDGRRIEGRMIDGDLLYDFHVTWTAMAGTPREEPHVPPVTVMSPGGDELRQAFNEDQDRLRMILTLSPT